MSKLQKHHHETFSTLWDCNYRPKRDYQKWIELSQHKSKTYVALWKLRASITDCVGENLFTHDSKISKIVFNPKLLSMLENMFTTSNATTIDSHGKFNLLSSSTMLSICDVCSVIT